MTINLPVPRINKLFRIQRFHRVNCSRKLIERRCGKGDMQKAFIDEIQMHAYFIYSSKCRQFFKYYNACDLIYYYVESIRSVECWCSQGLVFRCQNTNNKLFSLFIESTYGQSRYDIRLQNMTFLDFIGSQQQLSKFAIFSNVVIQQCGGESEGCYNVVKVLIMQIRNQYLQGGIYIGAGCGTEPMNKIF
eukprot:TRINITY_DN12558_c0_g1_i1.p1 TRINITY_DN12558_c0_g1~~TRINITY_DN12558_c0_g1_i1.p1  ORF type:complete len:190 (-),score=-8.07 TRINITY_DN12558_c0_g1_i1:234-803(-)